MTDSIASVLFWEFLLGWLLIASPLNELANEAWFSMRRFRKGKKWFTQLLCKMLDHIWLNHKISLYQRFFLFLCSPPPAFTPSSAKDTHSRMMSCSSTKEPFFMSASSISREKKNIPVGPRTAKNRPITRRSVTRNKAQRAKNLAFWCPDKIIFNRWLTPKKKVKAGCHPQLEIGTQGTPLGGSRLSH